MTNNYPVVSNNIVIIWGIQQTEYGVFMSKETKVNDFIDLKAFGASLADLRREAGYSNTEKFSQAINKLTGTSISAKTIYRIEHGEVVITLPQLVAYSLALSHRILSPQIVSQILLSALPRWKKLTAITEIEHGIKRDSEIIRGLNDALNRIPTYADPGSDFYEDVVSERNIYETFRNAKMEDLEAIKNDLVNPDDFIFIPFIERFNVVNL